MDTGAAEKRLVRVNIFQQAYSLRSTGDPGETEALAEAVDQLMNQIAARAGTTDPSRIAVLAALHLADQVRQFEHEADAARTELRAAAGGSSQLAAQVRQLEQDLAAARAGKTVDAAEHERLRARCAEAEARLADWSGRAARLAEKAAALND
jgi:cell division protein ZapA (FtsZ GTPase activity inhibitor)